MKSIRKDRVPVIDFSNELKRDVKDMFGEGHLYGLALSGSMALFFELDAMISQKKNAILMGEAVVELSSNMHESEDVSRASLELKDIVVSYQLETLAPLEKLQDTVGRELHMYCGKRPDFFLQVLRGIASY